MDLKRYAQSDQVDVAEALKATPPSLPAWYYAEKAISDPHPAPPQLIHGILHKGCKMILSGTSKSNKSWCLLNLAVSVSSGQDFWDHKCTRGRVLYINFELHPWAIDDRLRSLCAARPECKIAPETLAIWNLRGYNADITLLRPRLEEKLRQAQFDLIIIDPIYKVLGDRDENANGQVAGLLNEIEALIQATGAAVVIAHHYAKGDSTAKSAIDRMSGAGAWARDPDTILNLTPHEEDNCFTVTPTVRNLPQVPEFVVSWAFPLMHLAPDLNPESLRRPQSKNKICTDKRFMDEALTYDPQTTAQICEKAARLGLSRRTAERKLQELREADIIAFQYGRYWRTKHDNN